MSTAGEISGGGSRYYAEPRTHKRHGMDWYTEPRWVVDALLAVEGVIGPAWDPACGSGTIPKAIEAHGKLCWASDAAERPYGTIYNFLGMEPPPFDPVATIITNPPYGVALEFVERALGIATCRVAVLVQSKFPYSQRRFDLFTKRPPARIYHLSSRPSMPPGDKLIAGTVEAKGGKLDYCWIIWCRDHVGPTTAHWLRRPGK